jgi:hypothetical protein
MILRCDRSGSPEYQVQFVLSRGLIDYLIYLHISAYMLNDLARHCATISSTPR